MTRSPSLLRNLPPFLAAPLQSPMVMHQLVHTLTDREHQRSAISHMIQYRASHPAGASGRGSRGAGRYGATDDEERLREDWYGAARAYAENNVSKNRCEHTARSCSCTTAVDADAYREASTSQTVILSRMIARPCDGRWTESTTTSTRR